MKLPALLADGTLDALATRCCAMFDASDKRPLYWQMHDNQPIHAISKLLPEHNSVYLASFAPDNQGVHRIDYPPPLQQRP